MQRWRGQTSRINHTSCRFSVDRNLDPVEAWRLETRKVSPQKSWECHWEFQLVFVGALSGNMVYSAMHVYIYIFVCWKWYYAWSWMKLETVGLRPLGMKPRLPEVVLSVDKKCWKGGKQLKLLGDRSAEAQNFRTFCDFRSEGWARSLKIVHFFLMLQKINLLPFFFVWVYSWLANLGTWRELS